MGRAQADVLELLGLEIAMLRGVQFELDAADESSGDAFWYTENLSARSPLGGHWFGEENLAGLDVVDERDRSLGARWFGERRGVASARLQPWQREGWFAAASAWIRAVLLNVTGIEQFVVWSNSSVLRADTDGDRYYFKVSQDLFRHEARVTAILAERFPGVVPVPVAIDGDRGWMILEDLGDDLVGGKAIEHWAAALDTLVALQRSSVPLVESLLGLGLADRRLTVLETQIERFAEAVVQEQDLHRFLAAVPRLTGLCAELAASPIPFTLVHGDFHADNVAAKDDRYVIFDWTDACIAHPFVDVATFLHNFGPPSTDAVIRTSLRDRYLEGWSDLMPHADAVALFHRVEPLAAMHHAITSQTILAALDPSERWRFTSALPWWIDKALDSLDA